jgi:hypothetical protein
MASLCLARGPLFPQSSKLASDLKKLSKFCASASRGPQFADARHRSAPPPNGGQRSPAEVPVGSGTMASNRAVRSDSSRARNPSSRRTPRSHGAVRSGRSRSWGQLTYFEEFESGSSSSMSAMVIHNSDGSHQAEKCVSRSLVGGRLSERIQLSCVRLRCFAGGGH